MEVPATAAMEHMAMFSPDGKWIAHQVYESGQTERWNVRLYPEVWKGASAASRRKPGAPLPSGTPDSWRFTI